MAFNIGQKRVNRGCEKLKGLSTDLRVVVFRSFVYGMFRENDGRKATFSFHKNIFLLHVFKILIVCLLASLLAVFMRMY